MLARKLRALKGHDLEEGVSTRLMVYCADPHSTRACLIGDAIRHAMLEPLTDDSEIRKGLDDLVTAVMG